MRSARHADDADSIDRDVARDERRLRVPRTVWLERGERVHQARRHEAGRRIRVDLEERLEIRGRRPLAHRALETIGDARDPVPPDGEADRLPVTAEGLEKVGARRERAVQIDPADASPRAAPEGPVERDHERGPMKAL